MKIYKLVFDFWTEQAITIIDLFLFEIKRYVYLSML